MTALHIAARKGHANIVQILFENHADIDIQDADGVSVFLKRTCSIALIKYMLLVQSKYATEQCLISTLDCNICITILKILSLYTNMLNN